MMPPSVQLNFLRAEFQSPVEKESASSMAFREQLEAAAKTIEAPDNEFLKSVSEVVSSWSAGSQEVKKMFDAALSGKPLSQFELLYLQAATHEMAFKLESMSKVVETSSAAIKTTVQTQV